MKRLTSLGTVIALLGITAGCGGGGGDSTPALPASPAATSKTASVIARRSATFFNLGLSNTGKAAGSIRPTSPLQVTITAMMRRTGLTSGRANGGTYIPEMGLYMTLTTSSATSATASFYTDAAGSNPAGNITVTLLTSPNAFPATAQAIYNISGGTRPVSGKMTMTLNDATLSSGHLAGNLNTSANGDNVSFTFDLAISQGAMSGSMAVQDSCVSVALNNIVFSNGAMDANITANGLTGRMHLSADRSGSVTLTGSAGVTTATWNADGSGIIQYPDGHTDTITNFDALDPCS